MLASTIARNRHGLRRYGLELRRCMSVRPMVAPATGTPQRSKVTVYALQQMLASKARIAMLTAYDYPTASRADRAGVDITLVGDSLAQVALGFPSTTRLSLEMMLHHCAAVARGTAHAFLVADLPFGSHPTPADGVRAAVRLVREGGADAVKVEGGAEISPVVEALTASGVPVVGHVGLLPTRAAETGLRVQGRSAEGALRVMRDAQAIARAGAFAVVLEAIPHRVARLVTAKANEQGVMTIGIGAGPECNGQVLVSADAMGEWRGHQAKFVRRFAKVGEAADAGVQAYVNAVKDGSFPDAQKEGYDMQESEWDRLDSLLAENDLQ